MIELIASVSAWLPLVFLISVRIGTAFALMPAPFGALSPLQVRSILGLLCAVTIALPNGHLVETVPPDPLIMGVGAIGEALVGGVIGLTVRVTLAATEIAGTMAGFSMGLGFATSVDPTFGESSLPTTRAISAFAVVVFLGFQGHHVVLAALANSISFAPPCNAFGVIAQEGILDIGSDMLAQGLRISAPVVATMFIVQLGTGLVSRAAPKVHIFAMTLAIAITAGLLTLYVSAPSLAPAIASDIQRLPDRILTALGGH
jgi:flagellar biosynthetic protein FliR